MNKQFTIGLFGIYGLYNFGCEAIVRGTYRLIKKTWPNSKVILYTYRPCEDSFIVQDLDILCKKVPIHKLKLLRHIVNKFLSIISSKKRLSIWNAKAVAKECDMVFSIGGDIYTIPKCILDQGKEQAYSPIVDFGKSVLKNIPLVIWGASIGPFGEKKQVKEYYFNHLKDVDQIFCREEMTYKYLKENNITNNIQIIPDPAFYVRDSSGIRNDLSKNKSKVRVALNLSPLSVKEQVGVNDNQLKEQIINSVKDLLTIPNVELVLVPHVLSPFSQMDNDLIFLKDIYSSLLDFKNEEHSIHLLEGCSGFIKIKRFLQTCDIVIAARMHCAINAICEGIPTIFITYSLKGTGMTSYIYGSSKWNIPIADIGKKLKNVTLELLSNKEMVSAQIKERLKEIEKEEARVINLLSKLSNTPK
ncbi:MAG: polysaccharide pyruvyl transferase family protein [Firmicutes bacterium]|nr:polysaccharide pyruvyl transferase family protein [Bacillota bacterium]